MLDQRQALFLGGLLGISLVQPVGDALVLAFPDKGEAALVGVVGAAEVAADVDQIGAASFNEMPGGQTAPLVVVGNHGGDAVPVADEGENGNVGGFHHILPLACRLDDAADLAGPQVGHAAVDLLPVGLGKAENNVIADLPGAFLHLHGHLVPEVGVVGGQDHPDGVAVTHYQGPGHIVGVVVQLAHGLLDGQYGLFAHRSLVVQHPGYGGGGKTRIFGDVFDGRHGIKSCP